MANKRKKSQTQTQTPPELSASPLPFIPSRQKDIEINSDYVKDRCGKLVDELNESDFEEIHTCQIKKGGIMCNAPYFCHSSNDPHSGCTYTEDILIGDKVTVDGNCVYCLGQSVVCKPICHLPLEERQKKYKRKRPASLSIDGKLLSDQSIF